MMCGKCSKFCGYLLVALGIIFLLKDLGKWDFWGINWWTALIILAGVAHFGKSMCGDCQTCAMPSSGKRR